MASHNAHHSTGLAAGLIAAVVVDHAGAGGFCHLWSLLALVMGTLGGTAPDWLEVKWWTRKRKLWITHRTWTHWGLGWLALLAWSYWSLNRQAWAPLGFGFAAGGVMHLLADWPNPLGVPWLIKRRSLHLWKSGRCDLIVIAIAWGAAFVVADKMYFHVSSTPPAEIRARAYSPGQNIPHLLVPLMSFMQNAGNPTSCIESKSDE